MENNGKMVLVSNNMTQIYKALDLTKTEPKRLYSTKNPTTGFCSKHSIKFKLYVNHSMSREEIVNFFAKERHYDVPFL